MSDFKERLKRKLDEMKNPKKKVSFKDSKWSPSKDGEPSTIRLIKYPYGDDPFVELWFHYGVGGNFGILCPKFNTKEDCPICNWCDELRKTRDPQDFEVVKKIQAKQRVYAVVVDRADASLTPKYWGFGKQVYQELLEYLINAGWEHYMEVEGGHDITVKSEKLNGKAFPETTLVFLPKSSNLASSSAKIQEILKSIRPITEVFPPMPKAEIQAKLNAFMELSEADAESASSETIRGNGASGEEVVADAELQDVDKAFDEALG